MFTTYSILISEREGAPQTTLFVKLVYKDEASLKTKPYIFMLPGGPGANHTHYKDYGCLDDVANVVFFDPRGCGLSAKGPQSSYTMDNYIDDVEAIRRFLDLDRIILLGKSYGGMCSLGYTLRYPGAVDKLIVAAGSPSYKNVETAKQNILARGTAEQIKGCETLWRGDFKSAEEVTGFLDSMGTMYSYKKRHNEPTNRPIPDLPYSHEALNQGFSDFLRRFNYEDQLQAIACETLVLVGDEDWITDKKHSEFIASKIPHSKLIVFPHSDHSMESDVPVEFFNAIRRFVTSRLEVSDRFTFFNQGEDIGCSAGLGVEGVDLNSGPV